jgi:hypothetical protein
MGPAHISDWLPVAPTAVVARMMFVNKLNINKYPSALFIA